MYDEQNHIETAKEGAEFGHHGQYKYRVLNRHRTGVTHHSNDLDDAKKWFHECRKYWIAADELSE
jgi:hypothetical protein